MWPALRKSALLLIAVLAAHLSPAQSAPDPNLQTRCERVERIAVALAEGKSDPMPLLTEAVRLCGFTVRKEDGSKVLDPAQGVDIKLAVTETELKDFLEMYRAGHTVKVAGIADGLDGLLSPLGFTTPVAESLPYWLQTWHASTNAPVATLGTFIRALDRQHMADDEETLGPNSDLDPIQTLLILRVLTEEAFGPFRKALAKLSAEAGWASIAPEAAVEMQAQEAPGWAEDAFAGGITGLWDSATELIDKSGDGFAGKAGDARGRVNAGLSIIKFISSYVFLKGEIEVRDPGQPLVRTKDTSPGERRTLVAAFRIDATRAADWLKEHRRLLALGGIDTDMPKSGPLKGVETRWELGQSIHDSRKQLVQVVGYDDISKVKADENGEAKIVLEGKPQPQNLNPVKVVPLEKSIWVKVTPQLKATEIEQDLTDAVLGAIGVKDGPGIGFLTPVIETLYRMKWAGTIRSDLRIRDWQPAETVAELEIEVNGQGRNVQMTPSFRSEVYTINRSLRITDMGMTITHSGPVARFKAAGPGTADLAINDSHVTLSEELGCEGTSTNRSEETWRGRRSATYPNPNPGEKLEDKVVALTPDFEVPDLVFRISVERATMQATIEANFPALISKTSVRGKGKTKSTDSVQYPMEVIGELPFFQGLVVPVKETKIPGEEGSNFHGVVSLPFKFGGNGQFSGTVKIAFSISQSPKSAK